MTTKRPKPLHETLDIFGVPCAVIVHFKWHRDDAGSSITGGMWVPDRESVTLRAPTVAKLFAKTTVKLRAVLTSTFDGMIDGHRSENTVVSLDVVGRKLGSRSSSTRILSYRADTRTLWVHDACDDFDIVDADETDRRAAAVAELPAVAALEWRFGEYGGRSEDVQGMRARHLAGLDPIAFDEACGRLRGVTDPHALLSILDPARLAWVAERDTSGTTVAA